VQDLVDLINLKQEESLQLDFKRAESLDSTERRKAEISKDVSAFANSAGGTIVYGIGESAGEPHVAEIFSPIDPVWSKNSNELK
jgi:predicted HTH transcriptional regulator